MSVFKPSVRSLLSARQNGRKKTKLSKASGIFKQNHESYCYGHQQQTEAKEGKRTQGVQAIMPRAQMQESPRRGLASAMGSLALLPQPILELLLGQGNGIDQANEQQNGLSRG